MPRNEIRENTMWKVFWKRVPTNHSPTLTLYMDDAELAKRVSNNLGLDLSLDGNGKNVVEKVLDVSDGDSPRLVELIHYKANYPRENHISKRLIDVLATKLEPILVD